MSRRYLRLSASGRSAKGRQAVSNVGFPWLLPNREPTAALAPMQVAGQAGQPGTYDEIARGWPVVAEYVDQMSTALGAASYHWTAPDDPTPDESRFTELMADLSDHIAVDRVNGIEGMGALAETWMQHWTNGVYVGEIRAIDAPRRRANRAFGVWQHCDLELYPIHPSTIQQWVTDRDDRRLLSIRQQGATGGATITADRLIWVQRQGVVGEYVGISALRALAFPFERWKAIWLASQHSGNMQGGCLIVKATKNVGGSESWDRMGRTMQGFANGLAPYLLLEDGWETEFVAPAGSANFDQIELLDAYAKSKLGNLVGSLVSSASGHRALGEVVATQEQAQRTDELGLFLGRLGTRLARWVAERSAYGGRLPTLGIKPTDVTQTPSERIATAQAAITAFGLTPTVADQQWGREVAGLPVEEPDAVEVVPADGAAPVEMAEDLIPPNGAADSAAAAVLAWYDTPSAERGLSGRELDLAKRIAARGAISATEARMLSVWFRSAGDVTTDPTWQTKGRAYQAWHGRGGQAMAEWLRAMHDDVDGVPTPTPAPAPAPAPVVA